MLEDMQGSLKFFLVVSLPIWVYMLIPWVMEFIDRQPWYSGTKGMLATLLMFFWLALILFSLNLFFSFLSPPV